VSFRVLVIPEDATNNGYILQPLVEKMLAELGKPKADVIVLPNPRLMGYEQAVRAIRRVLIDRYKHLPLWLFFPDADCARGLDALEKELAEQGVHLFCCAAVPEVEAWLLAGHRDRLPLPWPEVRQHPRLKEAIFEPFLREAGNDRSAGAGRKQLTQETLSKYHGLLHACPELAELEARLRTFFDAV
jgi:hypothetical protein